MKRSLKNIIFVVLIIMMGGAIYFTLDYISDSGIQVSNSMQDVSNMSEPPEKPDNNELNDNSMQKPENSTDDMQGDMGEPPEKPDNENMDMTKPDNNFNNKVATKYYFVLTIECLILSYLIIYLMYSKFNKKTLKETYMNRDKKLIVILSTVILTGILTYLAVFVMNKYMININNQNNNNIQNNKNIEYSASKKIDEDVSITGETYTSSVKDENAILVDKANVDMEDITVNKTGDSDSGDNTSFYGTNSAIIAKSGANLVLKNINVFTDATGANGVFSYGGSAETNNTNSDGTTVTISDSKITTKKDNSGGIMATGGGVMKAYNLTVNTAGISSAAIRSDRGGGTITVDGGTYKTTGQGSPAIYSTAKITVTNAELLSSASEGVVIEGKNSVTLDNVKLIDTNNKLNGKSTTYKNIFLYQSMSGDASEGMAEFSAKNSQITTNKGDTFYITNTTATISLNNNTIVNNDSDGYFLRAQKDSWGKDNENGGDVVITMTDQIVNGNIQIDEISTLDMTLKTNSNYTGIINDDNKAKSIKLTLDKSSKIKLMGDSYVSELINANSDNSNIDFNGYKLYVNGKAIN